MEKVFFFIHFSSSGISFLFSELSCPSKSILSLSLFFYLLEICSPLRSEKDKEKKRTNKQKGTKISEAKGNKNKRNGSL